MEKCTVERERASYAPEGREVGGVASTSRSTAPCAATLLCDTLPPPLPCWDCDDRGAATTEPRDSALPRE